MCVWTRITSKLMFFGQSYDFVELLVPNAETAGRTADVRLGRAAGAQSGVEAHADFGAR